MSSMLNRKDHRSRTTTGQQVTALVRLSEAKDAYDASRIEKDTLRSACRVALTAGIRSRTIAEVSGLPKATIDELR